SWGDAPEGLSEEIKELTYSFGTEYWYDKQFAVRAGYFSEHRQKGNRKFFTVGLGLKYNLFGLNFSYLVPTTSRRNPLDNTLRFSMLFNFGGATDPQ
ncbi:MAG: PorV/PorQ family protein, partial [Bacteroidota bacterium]